MLVCFVYDDFYMVVVGFDYDVCCCFIVVVVYFVIVVVVVVILLLLLFYCCCCLLFQLLLNFIFIAILGIILFEIVGDRDMALIGFRIKKIPVCILFLMTWSIWH